ncbi:hypothetical protein Clacol_006855 [Clathrus columnatus]|uniref:Heme haloperoxidase family profile domain-containing protein n=1 Tax=Clathrus columnatus TaxID=1419009 RepID=A0AAV5AG31_9AGAM|nr:hypothetical protein Clacol_006855 [Clathrus columnatus]
MSSSGDEQFPSLSSSMTTTATPSPTEEKSQGCPFRRNRQDGSMDSSIYYFIDEEPNNPHCYRRPTGSDIRGPCPALNTLANHGYLPRDGKNITAKDLLKALEHPQTYNLTSPLARVLVYGGLLLLRQNGKTPKSISLYDIALHGRIEHNASVVHRNTPHGEIYAPIDVDLRLLEHFLEDDFMTIERIAKRRVELEVASPINGLHSEIARGEWSLVLGIFGKTNKGRINSDILNVWLQENRFVKGWQPSHRQSLIHTVSTSFRIRRRMKQFQQQNMKSNNDAEVLRKESYIKEALDDENEKQP